MTLSDPVRSTNTTGTNGIGIRTNNGGVYVTVSWRKGGVAKRTQFSVSQGGVQAVEKALLARAEGLGRLPTDDPKQVWSRLRKIAAQRGIL